MNQSTDGNRNNMLHRYGRVLVDSNYDFESARQKIMSLNMKLPEPLDEAEIMSTVMVTVGKEIGNRVT